MLMAIVVITLFWRCLIRLHSRMRIALLETLAQDRHE